MDVAGAGAPLIVSIDDDEDVSRLLAAMLEPEGYRVVTVSTGREGIEVVGRLTPDLVLLDVGLADVDGYSVCEQLQSRPETQSIPLVFLTAHDTEVDRARSVACGAVDRVLKPFDRAELLAKVARYVRAHRQWNAITEQDGDRVRRGEADEFESYRLHVTERLAPGSPSREAVRSMTPRSVYDALRSAGMDDLGIAEDMAAHLGLRFVTAIDPAEVAVDALPLAFCRKNLVAPMEADHGKRVYVVSNPFDLTLVDLLESQAGMQGVEWSLAVAVPGVIGSLFGVASAPGAPAGAPAPVQPSRSPIEGVKGPIDPNAPVVFIANNLLATAVRDDADEIDLDAREGEMVVRVRSAGETRELVRLKDTVGSLVVDRLKELAGLEAGQRALPQDGTLDARVAERDVRLWLATNPGPFGESLTVRLLDTGVQPRHLRSLGFTEAQAEKLHRSVERPSGLVIVAGLADSGRSTTVFSLLSSIDTARRRVMTVEDPVEHVVPGATHQQVDERSGVTFGSLVRFSLRQKPDVLFLEVLDDADSAGAAATYAQGGHLVVSTMTASDSTRALASLEALGVSRTGAAAAGLCIVGQRLIRSLCPDCRRLAPPDEVERGWISAFTDDIPRTVAHAVGCEYCSGGYRGRVGVHEVLDFDADVTAWVLEGLPAEEVRQRLSDTGWYMMACSAIDKVRDLTLSPEDAYGMVLSAETAVPRPGGLAASPEASRAPLLEPAPPPPVADGELLGARAPRVLFADDDEAMRDLISHALTSEGYVVELAVDGAEAFTLARSSRFDLIISDLRMPGLDGLGLLAALTEAGVSTPVVMLTGAEDAALEAKALVLGATDYVRKPVRKDVLLLRIGRVVPAPARRTSP